MNDIPEPRSVLVNLGERLLHVREWSGAGDTVVIAHGVTGCTADHVPLAQRLSERGFHVLMADAPGCGRSDPPDDRKTGFGLSAFAADFKRMIDQLAKGKVHWIGVSKGGGLGIRIAGQWPDYIRSLLLYDVGVSLPPAMTRALAERLAAAPRFTTLKQFRNHVERFFERNNCVLAPERLDEVALGWARRSDDGGVTYHYDPGTAAQFTNCPEDFELWPSWDAISCPCLILRGGNSNVLPDAEAQEMIARNGNASLRVITGAEHVNMLDDPILQNIIIAFVRDHQARGRDTP